MATEAIEEEDPGEARRARGRAIGCLGLIGACLIIPGVLLGGWPFFALTGIAIAFVIAALLS